MLLAVLEWVGAAFGVCGAVAVAVNRPWSKWGFVLFAVSNVCWLAQGILTRSGGMIVMQCAYAVINTVGIYRWIIVSSKGSISCEKNSGTGREDEDVGR